MTRKQFFVFIFLFIFLFTHGGCIGLPFKNADVVFVNPYQFLGVVTVAPNEEEKSGVVLRLKPSFEDALKSREETMLYARIKDGKGVQMQFTMDRTDRFKLLHDDQYRLTSETVISGQKGKIFEEKDLTERGEIKKLIRGFHHSKIGNFKISNWSRTPIFPERKVRLSDKWNYEESLEVRLESRWVKELKPEPYHMKAESTLKGFAIVKGRRTAMVETNTAQMKRESLKLFFKEVVFDIESKIQEVVFLDYKKGEVVARITQIQSKTTGVSAPFNDVGQSQSISYLVN